MPSSDARPLARPQLLEHGTSGVLSTGLAALLVLLLLGALLWIVAANAARWFWPAPIWELRLVGGDVVIGEIVRRELPSEAGSAPLLVKVGNRELQGQDHRVLDAAEIAERRRPDDLVAVTRAAGGDAFGRLVAARDLAGEPVDPADPERLAAVLAEADSVRQELRRDRSRLEALRRPLARAEQRLDRLRRGPREGKDSVDPVLAAAERDHDRLHSGLGPRLAAIEQAMDERRQRLRAGGLELEAGSGRLRVGLDELDEVVFSNRLGVLQQLGLAARRAVLFLVTWPREANTEGGIYPALFGTVLLVLLMSVAVMPLGVLAAVYLHEYAGDGWFRRITDEAVNNLAGVPSIVFGMFGLAFFVYGMGGAVDRAFFADELPSPTFGTGGILWASLTLAVLTIPVVVVATREGLQAVPPGWREGARALGATRLQTLRQIVLPAALPGILTGFILAVSRAAGEVAPLMLTGVVKLANGLPLDGEPPFLHLQRKFMHLGFHVYDVSMQSPNVEAAMPMAFASTLVLLVLVVAVNLTAIIVRRRVRERYRVLEG